MSTMAAVIRLHRPRSQLSIQQKETTIGGVKYIVQEFGTTEALYWTATLAQIGSGALLGVEKFPEGGIESIEIHPGKAIRGLLNHMPAPEFVHLAKKLYQESIVMPPYNSDDFETAFAGGKGLADLFELLAFIVEFNFTELWPTLKKTIAVLTGQKSSESQDQTDGSEQQESPSA